MLITSRDTHRWIIPKGNPIKGLRAHEAAAQEAYEEAGAHGTTASAPIGRYRYPKRRGDGRIETAAVDVFPLAVTAQAERWPEQDQRDLAWFAPADAAEAVDEPELKAILTRFRAPRANPVAAFWRRLLGA